MNTHFRLEILECICRERNLHLGIIAVQSLTTVRAWLNGNSTKWYFWNKNLFVETEQNGKLKMVIENGNFVDKMVIFVDELNIHKLSPKWYFCKKRGIPLVLVLFDTHEIWKWYFLENGTFWLFVFQTPTLTKMVTENGFSTKWYFCFPKRGWWWGNGLPFSRTRTVHDGTLQLILNRYRM